MRPFKMMCFSMKCCGYSIQARPVVKFENKYVKDCPDCGHALYKDFGKGNGKIKDTKRVYRPDAEYGFKTRGKYEDD